MLTTKLHHVPNSPVLIVASAPNSDDLRSGIHFCGSHGNLLTTILAQAGINRNECSTTYVCKSGIPGNIEENLFEPHKQRAPYETWVPQPFFKSWLQELKEEILLVKPSVIICMGNVALYALTTNWGIKSYRGYLCQCTLVPNTKVIPIWDTATLFKDYSLTFETTCDLRKAAKHSLTKEFPLDTRVLIEDATVNQFEDYVNEVLTNPDITTIGLDIETTEPGCWITRIGVGHSANFAMSLRLMNGLYPTHDPQVEFRIWEIVSRLLTEAPHKKRIIHNASFDSTVLWLKHNILTVNVDDTMLMAYACWMELPKSLGYLSSLLLDVPAWKMTSGDNLGLYNAADVANMIGIYDVLNLELDKQGIRHIYERSLAQLPIAQMLQLNGISINTRARDKLLLDVSAQKAEAQSQLNIIVGRELNVSSDKQLIQLLYNELKLPAQFHRKSKRLTTDADALEKLYRDTGNPILKLILTVRKYRGLESNISCSISPQGRVHTSYNVSTTDTARWSSSGSIILDYGSGNLQNITKFARAMYEANSYVSEACAQRIAELKSITIEEARLTKKWILQADYIQAEAVVVAYLTGDTKLKHILASGEDLHAHTASEMFGIPIESIHKDSKERKIGKTLRHGVNYSAGPKVVANKLGLQVREAKRLLDSYLSVNPLLTRWQASIRDTVSSTRTLVTPLGRRRRFYDRVSDDLFRSAYAYVPQSTVGDLLNIAMERFYTRYGDKYQLLLQLHDAVYVEIDPEPEQITQLMIDLKDSMIFPIQMGAEEMTIDIDFSVGPTWGKQFGITSTYGAPLMLAGKESSVPFNEAFVAVITKGV